MKDAAALYKADPLFGNFGKNPKRNQPNRANNRTVPKAPPTLSP
jgi:hypothetical protein